LADTNFRWKKIFNFNNEISGKIFLKIFWKFFLSGNGPLSSNLRLSSGWHPCCQKHRLRNPCTDEQAFLDRFLDKFTSPYPPKKHPKKQLWKTMEILADARKN
jgi:hypothetical protein